MSRNLFDLGEDVTLIPSKSTPSIAIRLLFQPTLCNSSIFLIFGTLFGIDCWDLESLSISGRMNCIEDSSTKSKHILNHNSVDIEIENMFGFSSGGFVTGHGK